MRLHSRAILRFDFERKKKEHDELIEQRALASREIERLDGVIERSVSDLEEIAREFDQLTGSSDDDVPTYASNR